MIKNPPVMWEIWVDPSFGKIPWRREVLPGEFYGQRNLAGCSPWGHKELDGTKQLSLSHIRNPNRRLKAEKEF